MHGSASQLETGRTPAQAEFDEAVSLHRRGRLADAAQLYRRVIDRGFQQPEPQYNLAVAEEGLVADTAVGEVLDLNLYHDGISVLKTDDTMTFDGTDIIKGQCIYAFAENLALSVIDAKAALVKIANVKYMHEAHAGERLIAKSDVMRVKDGGYIVRVVIKANMNEVFRGKFSLVMTDVK